MLVLACLYLRGQPSMVVPWLLYPSLGSVMATCWRLASRGLWRNIAARQWIAFLYHCGSWTDWRSMGSRSTPAPSPSLTTLEGCGNRIHAALAAVANQEPLPPSAAQVLNDCSTRGQASATLTSDGVRKWQLSSAPVEDALRTIAADAISIIAGERDGRIASCAPPMRRAAFFDTSRSRTRKWCDMGACGNSEKKARFLASIRRGRSAPDWRTPRRAETAGSAGSRTGSFWPAQ
ncbi:CGNR zinc finger domain-containing protein [Nocardiopsis deserti]|uniref:CGNR zinc finger domain-containing protein n=1 Tax=Nocardiopsis deserti TaxID=2605988 RepID=UPI002958A15E|nr:CGNR zinc finger domain-containing protein [Nocardiopsis deserti]